MRKRFKQEDPALDVMDDEDSDDDIEIDDDDPGKGEMPDREAARREGPAAQEQRAPRPALPPRQRRANAGTFQSLSRGMRTALVNYMDRKTAGTYARWISKDLRRTVLVHLNSQAGVARRLRHMVELYISTVYPYRQIRRDELPIMIRANPDHIMHALDLLIRVIAEDASGDSDLLDDRIMLAVQKEFLTYFYLMQASYLLQGLQKLGRLHSLNADDWKEKTCLRWENGTAFLHLRLSRLDHIAVALGQEPDQNLLMPVELLDDADFSMGTLDMTAYTDGRGAWEYQVENELGNRIIMGGPFYVALYGCIDALHRAGEPMVLYWEPFTVGRRLQWRCHEPVIKCELLNFPPIGEEEEIITYLYNLPRSDDAPVARISIAGEKPWTEETLQLAIDRALERRREAGELVPTNPVRRVFAVRQLEETMDFDWLAYPIHFAYLKAFETFIRDAHLFQWAKLPPGLRQTPLSRYSGLSNMNAAAWMRFRALMPPMRSPRLAPSPSYEDLDAAIRAYQDIRPIRRPGPLEDEELEPTQQERVLEFARFIQFYRSRFDGPDPVATLRHDPAGIVEEVDWVPLIPGITRRARDTNVQPPAGGLGGVLDPAGQDVRIASSINEHQTTARMCDSCGHCSS